MHGTLATGVGSATAFGNARLILKAGPESSLERRVEVLEQNLDRLRDEIQEKTDQVQNKLIKATQAIEEEKSERTAALDSITAKVEAVAVGGLQLEVVGLIWLAAGALCAAFQKSSLVQYLSFSIRQPFLLSQGLGSALAPFVSRRSQRDVS